MGTEENSNRGRMSNYHFNKRVEWDGHEPRFIIGNDHDSNRLNDFWPRSGTKTYFDRIKIDVQRISKFLYNSPQGSQFMLRQGALQLLNPQENTRTWNAGVSLLAQIAAAGTVKFKRSGLIPEPVGLMGKEGEGLNSIVSDALGTGDFLTNVFGGDYVNGIIGNENTREQKFGLGDPGGNTPGKALDQLLGDFNPFKKKEGYNVSIKDNENKIDKINFQSIFTSINGEPQEALNSGFSSLRDFVKFKFEVLKSSDFLESNTILFRAYIDSYSDGYTATHNEIKYNGRGEPFYTYNSFNRAINISFKIAAQSRHEMKPIYQKLNYLVAQTAPNYSPTGRIRTPFMRLTMGDYFKRIPGVLKNVNINWNNNYPWEIKLDPDVKDKDMKVLPHILDVSIVYQPIHNFVPNNGLNVPFIGIGGENGNESTSTKNNWLPNFDNSIVSLSQQDLKNTTREEDMAPEEIHDENIFNEGDNV